MSSAERSNGRPVLVVAAVAAMLGTGLLTAASPASARPPEPIHANGRAADSQELLPDRAQILASPSATPSDQVLTGVVRLADARISKGAVVAGTAHNKRPASGARITLSFLDLQDARVGAVLTPRVLASANADDMGRYALRLRPDSALLRKLAANSNYVNLDLGVQANGQVSTEAVGVFWNGKGWGHPARADYAHGVLHSTVLASDPTTGATTGGRVASSEVTPDVSQVIVSVPCSFVVTGKPTKYTKVVEFHSSGATSGSWRYGQTSDSDVDAGLNVSGTAGWKVSGSTHVGSSLSSYVGVDRSGVLTGNYGTTNMEFTQGYYKPYGMYDSYTYCSGLSVKPNTQSLKATRWLGGASSSGNLTALDCYDAPQSKWRNIQTVGSVFGTASARAAKLGAAASWTFISLGATSGFSTNVQLDWKWDKGRSGLSCGSNDYPPYAKTVYVN